MAEDIKMMQIYSELFQGKDAALVKYAKVRHTQYEIKLWREHGLPLKEVNKGARFYFSKRFLDGKKIEEATEEEIKKALETLDHAVNDGCKGRCTRLVEELNEELKKYYIEPVKTQSFLDWATFSYVVRKDVFTDQPCMEPGYNFEIWDFHDEYNRKEFYKEVKSLAKTGEFLHPGYVGQIVDIRRRHRKKL